MNKVAMLLVTVGAIGMLTGCMKEEEHLAIVAGIEAEHAKEVDKLNADIAAQKDLVKNEKAKVRSSRIELDDAALDGFTTQIDKILDYIAKLNELDTENTQPTSHALELKNIYREDINTPSLKNNEALINAPEQEDGHFKVPKII